MKKKAIITAGVLALCMAAGMLSGCKDKIDGTETAITVNGESISLGAANFLLRYQQAETTTMMESYGMSSETGLWSTPYTADSGSDADTYGEQFKNSSETEIEKMLLLKKNAPEYSVAISDDLQTSLDAAAEAAYEKNADAFAEMGITEDSIAEALELQSYQQLMFQPLVADTDTEVSDEEAAQTTVTYARISLKTTDDDGNSVDVSDEEKETFRQQLGALLSEVEKADDPASADIPSIASAINNAIVSTQFSYGSDDTILPDEVKDAVAGLQDGETYPDVIETSDGYLYIVRLDAAFDEEATASKKEGIVSQRQQDNYNDKVQAWLDDAEIKLGSGWKALEVTDAEAYKAVASSSDSTSSSTSDTTSESTSDSTAVSGS